MEPKLRISVVFMVLFTLIQLGLLDPIRARSQRSQSLAKSLCLSFETPSATPGKCECSPSETIYDAKHNVCLIKPGHECKEGYNCVNNAYCFKTNLLCHHDSGTSRCAAQRMCQCRDGFYENSKGYCIHGFNESCMTNEDCDRGFVCNSIGHCDCSFEEHYHKEKKTCIGVYGKSCSGSCETPFICKNARCQCPSHKNLTRDGRNCAPGLGAKCSKSEDCDSTRVLICSDGVCKCQHPLQEYNVQLDMCIGLEGAHCNLRGNQISAPFCVKGTTCLQIVGSSTVGMCKHVGNAPTNFLYQLPVVLLIFMMTGLAACTLNIVLLCRQSQSHDAPNIESYDSDGVTTTTFLSFIKDVTESPSQSPIPEQEIEENQYNII